MLLLAMLSRKMGNLFENFDWVLEKYYDHVFIFFIFKKEYLGCLIFMRGLFDIYLFVLFCTELTAPLW